MRPTGVTCTTHAGWKISEKGASAPLRAPARFKSAKMGRCDAEDAADEIRRDRKNGLMSKCLNIICGCGLAIVGDAQGGKVWYLATLNPSNTGRLCHPHLLCLTVKLANYQTIKLSNFLVFSNKKRISRASPPHLNKLLGEHTSG